MDERSFSKLSSASSRVFYLMVLFFAITCLWGCTGATSPVKAVAPQQVTSPSVPSQTLEITTNVLPVGTVQISYAAAR